MFAILSFSSQCWIDFRDLERSSYWGMVGSGMFVYTTALSNWFPVQRFIPRRACAGLGSAYFIMHALYYAQARQDKWIDDFPEDDD